MNPITFTFGNVLRNRTTHIAIQPYRNKIEILHIYMTREEFSRNTTIHGSVV